MLFNSYLFIFLFLPLALVGWYGLNRYKAYRLAQVFLVGMSLWFYAYFNISYLGIILTSCLVNYAISAGVEHTENIRIRKWYLILGCGLNIGLLGYFKYVDFFIENVNLIFGTDYVLQNIVLPLGISFFTLQQLSFVIDRCKGKAPHYSMLEYLQFVTFFPQLIAGPIVLHSELIPQFRDASKRKFDMESFAYGMAWFCFGLAKKVLLADNLAKAVNYGFTHVTGLDTISAIVVALAFTFELYFDFSGYCDMAVGIGKMFRIEIPDNFNAPYQSASVKEFWRRWHMTLGRFFTQYIYIPLGGNRRGTVRTCINTMIVFCVSGLWHGASWNYVFWGFLHGIGVAFSQVMSGVKGRTETVSGRIRVLGKRMITFVYVCIAFVFFRSESLTQGFTFIRQLCSMSNSGRVFIVAEQLQLPECYVITKLLSMKAEWLLPYFHLVVLAMILGISVWLICGKTTRQRLECRELTIGLSWKITILFVWSVISLTGVSTFLYFNF